MIENCTITGNMVSEYGGGIHCGDNVVSTIDVINCIVWNNTSDEIYGPDSSEFSITYSNIQGGYNGIGNINETPHFVSGPDGDYYLVFVHKRRISPSAASG